MLFIVYTEGEEKLPSSSVFAQLQRYATFGTVHGEFLQFTTGLQRRET